MLTVLTPCNDWQILLLTPKQGKGQICCKCWVLKKAKYVLRLLRTQFSSCNVGSGGNMLRRPEKGQFCPFWLWSAQYVCSGLLQAQFLSGNKNFQGWHCSYFPGQQHPNFRFDPMTTCDAWSVKLSILIYLTQKFSDAIDPSIPNLVPPSSCSVNSETIIYYCCWMLDVAQYQLSDSGHCHFKFGTCVHLSYTLACIAKIQKLPFKSHSCLDIY